VTFHSKLLPALLVGACVSVAHANPATPSSDAPAPVEHRGWAGAEHPMDGFSGEPGAAWSDHGREMGAHDGGWHREGRPWRHHWHRHGYRHGHFDRMRSPMMMGSVFGVLHELALTSDQKVKLKAIHVEIRSKMAALATSDRDAMHRLAALPPTDVAYAGLVSTLKSNAAARVQLHADLNANIYSNVLTAEQRTRAVMLMGERAKRLGERKDWKEQNPMYEEHVKS